MSGKKAKHKAVEDAIQTSTEAVEAMILPDAGVVLTRAAAAKGSAKTAETKPLPPEVAQKPVAQKSPAEWAYERIILYIQNFEEQLDPEQEMVMGHVTGGGGTMRIEGMGFFAPDLVTFYGSDENGLKTQLVQHVSQLTVMLRALPKPEDQPEALRIGFQLGEGLKEQNPAPKKSAAKTKSTAAKAAAKKKTSTKAAKPKATSAKSPRKAAAKKKA